VAIVLGCWKGLGFKGTSNFALIGFLNSREPLEAFFFVLSYLSYLFRYGVGPARGNGANQSQDSESAQGGTNGTDSRTESKQPWFSNPMFSGVLLLILVLIGLAASYVLSIYVGGLLIVGTAAPARASQVFVPKLG